MIRAQDKKLEQYQYHPNVFGEDWGWTPFCRKISTVTIPGDHYSMFTDLNNLTMLAKVIRDFLDALEAF